MTRTVPLGEMAAELGVPDSEVSCEEPCIQPDCVKYARLLLMEHQPAPPLVNTSCLQATEIRLGPASIGSLAFLWYQHMLEGP